MAEKYKYHIAINCRLLTIDLEGMGFYTHALLKYFIQDNPSVCFHLLLDKNIDLNYQGDNYVAHHLDHPIHSFISTIKWNFFYIKKWLKKNNQIDLFFSPDGFIPFGIKQKTALTIHDVSPFKFPQFNRVQDRYLYLLSQRKMARSADHVFTISNFSKQEINHFLSPKNISVHPNGLRKFSIQNDIPLSDIERGLDKGNYFLYYGSFHPRKNVFRIIKSFLIYRKEGGKNKLVLVGRNAWKTKDIKQILNQEIDNSSIIRIDYLRDVYLHTLIRNASAVVYTSLYEGFGLPVLESLSLRTQVITSKDSAMSEIGASFVHSIDPLSIDQHIAKYHELEVKTIVDQSVLAYIKKYDWHSTAKEMMSIMLNLIQNQ